MPTKSNISIGSTAVNDTHNASSESKKSLLQVGSSFIHRIQSSTNFMGPKHFNINIQLLDDLENVQGYFKKTSTGQDVLDFVCKELNIIEKEYFGLRYNDKYRYWVDLAAPLSKMFTTSNVALSFRVRFYPTDLHAIKEEVTSYNLFVQLQRDLSHGRLQCNQTESVKLAALILQAEQGDFDEERHLPGYVSEFKLLLRQSSRIEEKIAEHHKELRGMSSEVAINEFLKECTALQTYGINPYTVTIGKNQTNVVVGASSSRIIVFVMNQCVYSIPWNYVQAIDYSGKHLKIAFKPTYFSEYLKEHPDLSPDVALSKVVGSTLFAEDLKPTRSDKKMQLKFVCPNSTFAKHLWRDLLGQQVFFNEDAAKNVKPRFSKPLIPLLTRGSTFRCPTSRVMHELQTDTTPPRQVEQHEFLHYSLPRQKSRSEYEVSVIRTMPVSSVPSIRIETSSVHLNDSEVGVESEVSSSAVVPQNEVSQEEPKTEPHKTYNEIHVDSTETDAETKTETKELQNGSLVKDPGPIVEEPIPIENKNGAVANGKLTNGTIHTEERKASVASRPSLGRQIFVGILDVLVLLLLFAIIVIAVFEVVGPHEPAYFHPHISNFRRNFYNPWRTYAVNRYNHLFY